MAAEIISYITQYYGTNIETDIPDDSSQWVTSGIFYEFEYVWTRNLTTYDDNTSLGTNPVLTNNFNKVVSVITQYYGTDDEDDVPTFESQWVDTEPQTDYVWKRTRTEFIDGEVLYSDPERVNTGETDPEPEGPSTDEGDSSLILIDTSQEFYGTDDAEETPDAQTVWSTETPKDKIYIWIRVKTTYERETPDGNIPVIEYSEPTRDISEDERSHEGDDLDPATPIPADNYTPPESASDATAEDEIQIIIPTEPIPEPSEAEVITDWVAAQQLIFEKLTAFGQNEGIFYWEGEGENKQLFINASFIRTGILQVGGTNNKFGVIQVLDTDDSVIGQWDKTGFALNQDSVLRIGSNDTARLELTNDSMGLFSAENSKFFEIDYDGAIIPWPIAVYKPLQLASAQAIWFSNDEISEGVTRSISVELPANPASDTIVMVKQASPLGDLAIVFANSFINSASIESAETTNCTIDRASNTMRVYADWLFSTTFIVGTPSENTLSIRFTPKDFPNIPFLIEYTEAYDGYKTFTYTGHVSWAGELSERILPFVFPAGGLISGDQLETYAPALVFGINDDETHGAYAVSLGQNLKTEYNNQTAIGLFNANRVGNLFEIGNGTSDTDRRNAFAISITGEPTINRNLWLKALGMDGTGTYKNVSLTSSTTVPTGATPTALLNLTLPKGTWLVVGQVSYQSGGTAGSYRAARLGSTATGNQYANGQAASVAAGNTVVSVIGLLNLTAEAICYLSAMQGSGADLTVPRGASYTFLKAIQIK